MKSIKRFVKRTLSVVLCLAMVMTTMFFFDIGITKPEAKIETTASSPELGRVAFFVPEIIYLRPASSSWDESTSAAFQFYIENDPNVNDFYADPTTSNSARTTGSIYFAAEDGFSNVSLSYQFEDSTGKALSGSVTTTNNGTGTAGGGTFNSFSITGGTSPSLASGERGCYLKWTLTYKSPKDNIMKSVVAYSYVYKPYVIPVAGGTRIKNTSASDNYFSTITWLTGIHSIKSGGTHYARYKASPTNVDSENGLLPFLSTQNILGNGTGTGSGTQGYVENGNGKSMYMVYSNQYMTNGYFATAYGGDPNPDGWFSGANTAAASGNNTAFDVQSVTYVNSDGGDDWDDTTRLANNIVSAQGNLLIDTSRYSNLNQIPNLGIGLFVVDANSSDYGATYVADFTGRSSLWNAGDVWNNTKSNDDDPNDDRAKMWDNHGDFITRISGELGSSGQFLEKTTQEDDNKYHGEGIKYAGTWPKALASGSTATYKFKTCAIGEDGRDADSCAGATIIQLNATQVDRSALRSAVYAAIEEFSRLGVYDKDFNSRYFKNEGAYTTFVNAYTAACRALTDLTNTYNDSVRTNLNNAIAALRKADTDNTIKSIRKTGTAIQYNVGLVRQPNGYRVVEILDSREMVTQPYYLRDKVVFSPETFTGYTFKGFLKVADGTNLDVITAGNVLSSMPASTSASNKKSKILDVNSAYELTIAEGSVSTSTEVATFTTTDATYPYAYDSVIEYVYFYEINEAEVIYGNEFDFDRYFWNNSTVSGCPKYSGLQVDYINNTVTLNTNSGSGSVDAYTPLYTGAAQTGFMTLIPGRKYEFSCTAENLSNIGVGVSMFLFTFAESDTSLGTHGAQGEGFECKYDSVAAKGTVTIKGFFTIPAGRPWATLRVGVSTPGASVKFSNICVRDISTFTNPIQDSGITYSPEKYYDTGAANATVSSFPTPTRTGYQFAGWSTVRAANGNGDSANLVTSTTVPEKGNRTLYPIWQTNVIYDTNGGFYRKSSDPLQTSYQAEGRWNVAIGTSVAVSNRIVQGQTDWNSTDVNNTYVPYKPGYNFKGWLAESVDTSVNGKTYWPGNAVVTNANVEFTAQWEAAPSITTQKQQVSSSANGGYSFYPGQIYFYGFTPTDRGMYVSAYTFDPGQKTVDGATVYDDFELHLFNSALEELDSNTDRVYTYGLDKDDNIIFPENSPMVTRALDKGSKYYYGLTLQDHTTSSQDATSFKITEHTINFTLNPAKTGATISGSATPITKIGYGNEDTVLPTDGELFGYDFAGWTTQGESPEKTYTMGTDSTCVIPGADNTAWLEGYVDSFVKQVYLNANWTADKFGVVYDGNPGSSSTKDQVAGVPSNGTFTYDSDGQVSDSTPTMPGYTFKGWALTSEQQSGETLYTTTAKTVAATTVNQLYTDMFNAGETTVTLYARWAPNVIIVRFKPGTGAGTEFTQQFLFDTPQNLTDVNFSAETFKVSFYNVDPKTKVETLATTDEANLDFAAWESNADVINPVTGKPYSYLNNELVTNPNGIFGYSDEAAGAEETILNATWKGGEATVSAPVLVNEDASYILAGWAEESDKETVKYLPGADFIPDKNVSLYAVWYSTEKAEEAESNLKDYQTPHEIVTGIKIKNAEDLTVEDNYEVITAGYKIVEFDTTEYQNLVNEYNQAKAAFETAKKGTDANAKIAANNAFLTAIRNLEAVIAPDKAQKAIKDYLTKFRIEYADGVTGAIDAGEYSVADMNLNHYTEEMLGVTLDTIKAADILELATEQEEVNKYVTTLARAFASKEDVKTEKAPLYNVFETAASINGNAEIKAAVGENETPGVSYVFTKYDANTYYCYTNALKPTVFVSVDDIAGSNDRVCYPTTAKFGETTMMAGSLSDHKIMTMQDETALAKYQTYLDAGLGTSLLDEDPNYYSNKSVVKLTPDFSTAKDRATVRYELTAHDDSFAGLDGTDKNYASTSKLSTKEEIGVMKDETSTETPELTIIFNYHKGNVDVNGMDVPEDKWIKQYHLSRTSGGANNWEYGKVGDTVYTLDDPTYGQTGFGSFTYTFKVNEGAENDFVNCVLNTSDLEEVKELVAANYGTISSVPFDGAQEIWKWATDPADGVWKYMKTHEAGTGLGYLVWPSGWSFNYYPASQAYTYVHIVDRWGNAVDKIIQVPNLDASPTQLHTNAVGAVDVIEVGGSGIETMSFTANSFEIIPDEGSIFDGETYTTEGNTIKVYTGEANKTYSLTANDVATNKTTENVTTDAEGYLTITVEDKEFDTQSGAYTFTLNGMEINLYAEVEKNIVSAEDVSVEEGQTATVEIVTTDKVTSVQLVSPESGSTTTATTYEEDENGNRVWTLSKKKTAGEYEYKVRYKTDGGWLTEGDTVKVTVTKPIIFVGAVTEVSYTPSTSTRNEFMFTVTGRPDKIQVISEDGGTRTYDRYHVKVVIVSYDAEGNVVGAMSRDLSYEVWTIEMNVPAGEEFTAVARYGREWSKDAPYKYTVVLATPEFDDEVYEMKLAASEGEQGRVVATVVTGLDVSGVKFTMDNNTTATYYTSTEADGKLTYTGDVWINHRGDNVIIVKIRVNNAWLNAGELNYYAI